MIKNSSKCHITQYTFFIIHMPYKNNRNIKILDNWKDVHKMLYVCTPNNEDLFVLMAGLFEIYSNY